MGYSLPGPTLRFTLDDFTLTNKDALTENEAITKNMKQQSRTSAVNDVVIREQNPPVIDFINSFKKLFIKPKSLITSKSKDNNTGSGVSEIYSAILLIELWKLPHEHRMPRPNTLIFTLSNGILSNNNKSHPQRGRKNNNPPLGIP
jgi:hypothetical protein